jgi:putative chitinase
MASRKQLDEETLQLQSDNKSQDWIDRVYEKYPQTWQNNHVMTWGEGDQQELAMFELVPNPARKNTVELKWFQAYPLRQGVGSRALRELQQLAQEDGISLTLYAWDKGQVSRSKLMKFYRQMGFNPTAKKSASMIWHPTALDEVTIDNREGAGAVPYNQDVDYFGLRVRMQPSTFLKLAAPLGGAHSAELEKYIAQGGAIGAPFLMVDIPEGWGDGDFTQTAEVTGHEGRNRVSAVLKLEGDDAIEMHVFPRFLRRRHLTPEWIEALNRGLIAEHSGRMVPGPLFDDATLEEGWREKAAAAATAATLAYGGMHNINQPDSAPAAQPGVVQKAIQKSAPSKPAAPFVLKFADKNPVRDYLVQRGKQAGFSDIELAHLVSQVQHETMDFKHLEELGTPKYFARKYDKRYNPRKARILGNVKPGDGERYKGRGFVHLTGRDNYTRAGQALGVDLVNKPQLAADPKVAADIAVWFWKNRVQPRVDDFPAATVAQVTKPINPGLKGLQDREAKFQKIANR